MMMLALAVAFVTLSLALLHAYWGFGGVWPGTDKTSLSNTVTGFENVGRIAPVACFLVAFDLAFTALVALVLGGVIASPLPFFILGPAALIITLVFVGRGIAGYTSGWRSMTPMQPFARLDRLYYSPLCLALGAGFFTLSIRGFSA